MNAYTPGGKNARMFFPCFRLSRIKVEEISTKGAFTTCTLR